MSKLIQITEEEFEKCKRCQEEWWAERPGDYYKQGIYKYSIWVGALGETAVSRIINKPVNYAYQEGGDKYDFILDGGKTVDSKCNKSPSTRGLVTKIKVNGRELPVNKDLYIFSCLTKEFSIENKTPTVNVVGYLTKEEVLKCEVVRGYKKENGKMVPGDHFNYKVPFNVLRPIDDLVSKVEYKTFKCGCKFPVVDCCLEMPDEVPENCQKTWDLICDGLTWGVFQLDSSTGQKYSEEAKPKNIDEMADVQSIIRPGTLGVKEDGKNLAQHYCDRKHNKESADCMHSSVEDILKDTQQIIVYQEQAIFILKKLAGFTGDQADLYGRKAIGKKLVDLINEGKTLFIEGCKKVGLVNEEKALEIFQGIEAAGRYSFNKCLCPETTVVYKAKYDRNYNIDYSACWLKDIKVGDDVEGDMFYPHTVKNIHKNGVLKTYKVYFITDNKMKFDITCSATHKFKLSGSSDTRELYNLLVTDERVETFHGAAKITHIEDAGFREVWDLELTENKLGKNDDRYFCDHLYYANGILTHNSHAVSYSYDAYYYSAYIKAHFPHAFYCTEMDFAKDNEAIKDAINDAKKMGISVRKPSLLNFNCDSEIKDKDILFPLMKIKFCSSAHIQQIKESCDEMITDTGITINELKYIDWLTILKKTNKKTAEVLIKVGAMDFVGMPRERFLKDFEIINQLTGTKSEAQLKYIKRFVGTLSEAVASMIDLGTGKNALLSNKRVIPKMNDFVKILHSNESITKDSLYQIAEWEKEFLGIEITCTKLDSIVSYSNSAYDCMDVYVKRMNDKNSYTLNCIIDSFSNWENDQGKTHCFIKIYDNTCLLDAVMFDKNYSTADKKLFYSGNTITVKGKRSGRSFLIDAIKQL